MNRRGFLKALGAAAVGMTIDPERLLWRPGAKTIIVMNGNPFWSSQLATSNSVLTFEMLRKAIKAIEDQIGLPPRDMITSPAIKFQYERLLRDESPTIPLVRATNDLARRGRFYGARLTY